MCSQLLRLCSAPRVNVSCHASCPRGSAVQRFFSSRWVAWLSPASARLTPACSPARRRPFRPAACSRWLFRCRRPGVGSIRWWQLCLCVTRCLDVRGSSALFGWPAGLQSISKLRLQSIHLFRHLTHVQAPARCRELLVLSCRLARRVPPLAVVAVPSLSALPNPSLKRRPSTAGQLGRPPALVYSRPHGQAVRPPRSP